MKFLVTAHHPIFGFFYARFTNYVQAHDWFLGRQHGDYDRATLKLSGKQIHRWTRPACANCLKLSA